MNMRYMSVETFAAKETQKPRRWTWYSGLKDVYTQRERLADEEQWVEGEHLLPGPGFICPDG